MKPEIYRIPQWPEVKGIYVGDCIARVEAGIGKGYLPGNAQAHAHNRKGDKYFGWVCVENESKLGVVKGKTVIEPSNHLRHEYRHLLAPNQGHTDKWRTVVVVKHCSKPSRRPKAQKSASIKTIR